MLDMLALFSWNRLHELIDSSQSVVAEWRLKFHNPFSVEVHLLIESRCGLLSFTRACLAKGWHGHHHQHICSRHVFSSHFGTASSSFASLAHSIFQNSPTIGS
jgi:hypothetical protein